MKEKPKDSPPPLSRKRNRLFLWTTIVLVVNAIVGFGIYRIVHYYQVRAEITSNRSRQEQTEWLMRLAKAGDLDIPLEYASGPPADHDDIWHRRGEFEDISEAAAKTGQMDRVFSWAGTVTEPFWQSFVYSRIALGAYSAGDHEAVAKAIRLGFESAEREGDIVLRSKSFTEVAEVAATTGQTEMARKELEHVVRFGDQVRVRMALATSAKKSEQIELAQQEIREALNAANQIDHIGQKIYTLTNIARQSTNMDQKELAKKATKAISDAFEIVSKIKPDQDQPHFFESMAAAAARMGELEKAMEIAARIPDQLEWGASVCYHAILKSACESNRPDLAWKAMRKISDSSLLTEACGTMASLAIKGGDLQKMADFIALIKDPHDLSKAYAALAEAVAKAGLLREALELTAKIPEEPTRQQAYELIATLAEKAGQVDVAIQAKGAILNKK